MRVSGDPGPEPDAFERVIATVTDKANSGGKAERKTRLAEALRANLQRRKAQARQREGKASAGDEAGPGGQAGNAPDRDAGKT